MRITGAGLKIEFSERSIMMWFAMNLASLAGSYLNKKELTPADFLQSFLLASFCSLLMSCFFTKEKKSPNPKTAGSAQFWLHGRELTRDTNLTEHEMLALLYQHRLARKKHRH